MNKVRISVFLALLLVAVAAAPPAHAAPCVIHGREIRNREAVTCTKAKTVAAYYFGHFKGPGGWDCQGYRGQAWKGYCETPDGSRYFSWRLLD